MLNFYTEIELYTQQRNHEKIISVIDTFQKIPYLFSNNAKNYVMSLSHEDYIWLTEQHFLMFDNEHQYSLETFAYHELLSALSDEERLKIAHAIYQKYPKNCNALGPLLLTITITPILYQMYKPMFLASSRFIPSYVMMHQNMMEWRYDETMAHFCLDSLWYYLQEYPIELINVFSTFYNLDKKTERHPMLAMLLHYRQPQTDSERIFLELYQVDPLSAMSFWTQEKKEYSPYEECDIIIS